MKDIGDDQLVGLSLVVHAPFLAYAIMTLQPTLIDLAAVGLIAVSMSAISRFMWLDTRKQYWVAASRIAIMTLFFATILIKPEQFTALHALSLATSTAVWVLDILTNFTTAPEDVGYRPGEWLQKVGLSRDEEEHSEIARFAAEHAISREDVDTLSLLADMAVFNRAVSVSGSEASSGRLQRFKELLLAEKSSQNETKDDL